MTDDRPVPHPTELSRPFWSALAQGDLVLQRCDSCGNYQHPPQHMCGVCHGTETSWVPVAKSGTLYSYTLVYRAPTPEFAARVPYAVGIADIDATGVRLLSNVLGDVEKVSIGMRVEVVTERVEDDMGLFFFCQPDAEGESR